MKPLSLYIHVPFCHSRCRYCDFYSTLSGSPRIFESYKNKLTYQYEILVDEWDGRRGWDTLYLGGGTPSILPVDVLEGLLNYFSHLPSCSEKNGKREITLEVNPESLTKEKLLAYANLGINRLSMGVQSFNGTILKAMGRLADPGKVNDAIRLIQKYWPGDWSLDMIFAYPGQTLTSQVADIEELVLRNPPHISLYTLTVEEGTRLWNMLEQGKMKYPDDEEMEEAWFRSLGLLGEAGYNRYEISSFCRNDNMSRHNLNYWDMGEWFGLGPGGASSRVLNTGSHGNFGIRRFTGRNLREFLIAGEKNLLSGGSFYETMDIDKKDVIGETLMMGLRTTRGISRSRLLRLMPRELPEPETLFENSLAKWQKKISLNEEGMALTEEGLDWHSAIMVDLLLDLDKHFDYNNVL